MRKIMVLVWAFLALFMAGCASERIYVGGSDGIFRMKLFIEPRVWFGEKVSSTPGVSYMARQGKFLYAARKEAKNAFSVDAYQILNNGSLKALNTFKIPGNTGYCHISLTTDGKFLLGSAYSGGFLDLLALAPDGKIQKLHTRHFFKGKSIHPRQKKSHPHFSAQTPEGSMVLVADLGSDRIHTFKYDAAKGLTPGESIPVIPGAGPRHLSFSDDGKFFFAANELNNTVISFSCGKDKIRMIDSCSLLPAAWSGKSYAGAIKSIPGKRICVTNRGNNSVAVIRYDALGKMKVEKIFSAEGDFPYDLEYINGKLFGVNMRSDSFISWQEENRQWKTKHSGMIRRPMCIVSAE